MNYLISLLLVSCSLSAMTTVKFHQCKKETIQEMEPIFKAFSESFDDVLTESWMFEYDYRPELFLTLKKGNASLVINKNNQCLTANIQLKNYNVSRLVEKLEKVVEYSFYNIDDTYEPTSSGSEDEKSVEVKE